MIFILAAAIGGILLLVRRRSMDALEEPFRVRLGTPCCDREDPEFEECMAPGDLPECGDEAIV